MAHRGLSVISGLLIVLSGAACGKGGSSGGGDAAPGLPEAPSTGGMTRFSSPAELEAYLKEQFAGSVLPIVAYERSVSGGTGAASGSSEARANSATEAADYSRTNVQEQGVDESDKVKTDGAYLYVARDRNVKTVKAVPPDAMSVVATIDVNGIVDSLYLHGDILVVLFTPSNDGAGTVVPGDDGEGTGETMIGMPVWIPVESKTGILIVSVASPENPATLKEITVEGWLSSSRLVDGHLHIVQQFLPELPPLALSYDGTEQGLLAAREANVSALEDLAIDDLLPSYEVRDGGVVAESGPLVDWTGFYRPGTGEGGSVVTVTSVNLNDPSLPFQSVGIVADIHVVYASTRALYLASTRWNEQPVVLSETGDDLRESTVVHKFDLAGAGATPVGNGCVWGRILNQFSLGEYENILRIATTTGFAGESRSHLFCLREEGGDLRIVGRIENVAPGEQLYAARFIDTRGFLVTFLQVDPLFVLDLSDPTAPRVAGELEIPGYSTYLHPLAENRLLTIGYNTDEFGTPLGLQLSLFDVSDPGNPALLHRETIGDGGTFSEALYDHRAFTYHADGNLLAIPVMQYGFGILPLEGDSVGSDSAGLSVYRVTVEEGFAFLGRIAVGDGLSWTRGIFIDDSVYAVVADAVRSADTNDIANTIRTLDLGDGAP